MWRQLNLNNIIESIIPQKRSKNRFNIHCRSGDVFGISGVVLLMHGITVGQDISIDLLSKIKADELFHSIRSKALNFLSYRDRSTKELERSLLQKGYHYDQIKIILDELTLKGYLNDKKFTRVYANHLIKTKLLGKIAVINRFMKHNIPQEVLNPIMDELYVECPPDHLIKKIIKKRMKLDNQSMGHNKKMIDYLRRKGFTWDEISSCLND